MGKIIGVQFQKNGKIYYFDANGYETRTGDYVVVDTARGYDLGEVSIGTREIDDSVLRSPLKKMIRIADERDIQHSRDNRQKEKEAFSICQKKIAEHKLEMKLVSVEYAFDNSKILFFFTANGRVDFRSLVKDLASIFKMRIELRQIGVRDEAKMLGGLGPCGRPICCGTFLEQFQPVSIKMAKEQNLSLNPTKISGVCGRLMCCLKYEQEHYEMTRKKMPKIGREVSTPDGTGSVTDLNIVKETVFVRLTNGDTSEIKEYPLDEINKNQSQQSQQGPDREAGINESLTNESPSSGNESTGNDSDDHEEKKREADQSKSAPKPDQSPKTSGDKRKTRSRKGALGQPVKRENPNRTDMKADKENPAQSRADKEVKPTKHEQVPHQNNAWADALEKAMNAINREK